MHPRGGLSPLRDEQAARALNKSFAIGRNERKCMIIRAVLSEAVFLTGGGQWKPKFAFTEACAPDVFSSGSLSLLFCAWEFVLAARV